MRSTCSSGSRFYANLVINNALASRPGPEVITAKKPEVLLMPYALCRMPYAVCLMSQRYGCKAKKSEVLLYRCPSCYYICSSICSSKRRCYIGVPLATTYVSSYCCVCVLILLYVSSYCCICVLILLCMCPHTAVYVSSCASYTYGHARTSACI